MLSPGAAEAGRVLAGSFLMFLAMLTVFGMFISDVLLAVLDPHIRLGGRARR